MTDANTICHDVDLLGDWLDAKGYTEEAGLCLRVLGLIHAQAEENEKLHNQAAMNGKLLTENAELREALRESDQHFMRVDLERTRLRTENEKLRAALKLCVCRPNEIAAALKGDGDEN